MFTVAGVPFTLLWRWRCPGDRCKVVLVRAAERELQEAAVRHYQAHHGPLNGQATLELEL